MEYLLLNKIKELRESSYQQKGGLPIIKQLKSLNEIVDETSLSVNKTISFKENLDDLIDITEKAYKAGLSIDKDIPISSIAKLNEDMLKYKKKFVKASFKYDLAEGYKRSEHILMSDDVIKSVGDFEKNMLELFKFIRSTSDVGAQSTLKDMKTNILILDNIIKIVSEYDSNIKKLINELTSVIKFNFELNQLPTKLDYKPYSYTSRYSDSSLEKLNHVGINAFKTFVSSILNRNIINTNFLEKVKRVDDTLRQINIEQVITKADSIIKMTGGQKGGIQFNLTTSFFDDQVTNNLNEALISINKKITILKEIIKISIQSTKIYRELYIRINYFIVYIGLIIDSYGNKEDKVYYEYINKGIVQFNRAIIKSIIKKFDTKLELKEIGYMNTYHYVTLHMLDKAFDFLFENLTISQTVKIYECKDALLFSLMVFNHFKEILISYNLEFQYKVMIYSRINDWDTKTNKWNERTIPMKMFKRDIKDPQIMIVEENKCTRLKSQQISKIKFNEVFSTEDFKENLIISEYMTLEAKISRGQGIMLITYGYSGTGKTFTLFGDETNQGLMQSTLNNIKGLKKLYFRVYEFYGIGVQYPHYWQGKIKKNLISYTLGIQNIKINSNNNPQINVIKENYIENDLVDSFITNNEEFLEIGNADLDEDFISLTLKKFELSIKKIDQIRKDNKRIVRTPNNPESSRSIIIYEFQCLVDKKLIPLIIVDLPGREEIVETYTLDYLSKQFIPNSIKTHSDFYLALLSSMAINPLYMAILVPGTIFQGFNNLDRETRNRITKTVAKIDGKDCIFQDEFFTTLGSGTGAVERQLDYIYDFANSLWQTDSQFNVFKTNNLIYNGSPFRVQIKGDGRIPTDHKPSKPGQVDVEKNSTQYQGALAIHLLNRMITMGEFEAISSINKFIIETYIDFDYNKELPTETNKREFLINYLDREYIDKLDFEQLKKEISDITKFTSYITPYEGIFINENIVGLIKILAKDVMNKTVDELKSLVERQDSGNLDFFKQKTNIRLNNIKLYSDNNDSGKQLTVYENMYRNNSVLKSIYLDNTTGYSSQKIFNYEKPLISEIIDNYTHSKKITFNQEELETVGVTDFKVFYLFTNNDAEKKCSHQFKLLSNTKNLIKAVEN